MWGLWFHDVIRWNICCDLGPWVSWPRISPGLKDVERTNLADCMLNWSSTSLPCQGERKVLDISWSQVSSWQSMTGSFLSGTRILTAPDISDLLEYTPILPPTAEFAQFCRSKDCIFYSDHWTLLREGKGSSAGSDHKPVYAPCQKWGGRQPWRLILGDFVGECRRGTKTACHTAIGLHHEQWSLFIPSHPSHEFSDVFTLPATNAIAASDYRQHRWLLVCFWYSQPACFQPHYLGNWQAWIKSSLELSWFSCRPGGKPGFEMMPGSHWPIDQVNTPDRSSKWDLNCAGSTRTVVQVYHSLIFDSFIWRYHMGLSGMVWHLPICAQEAGGMFRLQWQCFRLASAMLIVTFRTCWNSFLYDVPRVFPYFYMRFVEQTADKRCKINIQKLVFNFHRFSLDPCRASFDLRAPL